MIEAGEPRDLGEEPDEGIALRVDQAEVSPGEPSSIAFALTNNSAQARRFELAMAGLEPAWFRLPESIGPIEPGETFAGQITLSLPVGHPASRIIGSLSVRAADDGAALKARADVVIEVGDGSLLVSSVDPNEATGWRFGRLSVVLRNRARTDARVELSAISPNAKLHVHFDDARPIVPPGREVRVRARVRAPLLLSGTAKRHPFGVRVSARSTPSVAEAAFVQRAVLSPKVMKATVVLAVAALWITAAAIGISALSNHVQKAAISKAVSAAPPLGPPNTSAAGTANGASNGSGGGSASPQYGPASPGASKAGALAARTVRVAGRVVSNEPGGVEVIVTPTSLTDPAVAGATPLTTGVTLAAAHFVDGQQISSLSPGDDGPAGKVFGTMVGAPFDQALLAADTQPTMSTKTSPDGSWAIAGLKAPGTYLVTFVKAGFETKKFLLTTSNPGTTLSLNATINPGNGAVSGSVTNHRGVGLGGVAVTLTDGTVTLSTRTISVGPDIGSWSITGLSTPAVYLVTASKDGYGTQTASVNLGASESRQGLVIKMFSGVASLTGTVTSTSGASGIGGVSVTASDGTTSEHATTTTVGKVGSYTLPNLKIPGKYALTFSAPGYMSQTEQVALTSNDVVDTALTQLGANVIGIIEAQDGTGLGGAGVTLSDGDHTYKTLTQSTNPVGSFDFNQVPSGNYVLEVSDYGYYDGSAQVVVAAGSTSTTTITLKPKPAASNNTAVIQGTVVNLFDQNPVAGATVQLDGSNLAATTSSNGNYQISQVAPGVHTVSASANGYELTTVQVDVPLGGIVIAPRLQLPKLDSISGVVTSAAGTGAIAGATVSLALAGSTTTTTIGATTTTTTTTSTTTTVASSTTTTVVAQTSSTTSTDASGGYSLVDLVHGNYSLTISAAGYVTQILQISLAADENLHENITLTLQPAFNVIAYTAQSGGGVAQSAGVCVTVTGAGYSSTELTSASAPISFSPLVAGQSYTASFWQPSGHTGTVVGTPPAAPCPQDQPEIGTAPSTTFTATNNNASIYSAFIAPQLPALSISLTYQYQESGTGGDAHTVDCPVITVSGGPAGCPRVSAAPSVTLTGITSYTTGTNGSLGSPVLSGPISPVSPVGTTSNTWSFPPSSLNALISNQVSLNIDGTSTPFETIKPNETLNGTTPISLSFILTPTPVLITGTITPASGVSLTIDPNHVPVSTASNSVSPGTITASDTSGNLVWGDTQVGTPGLAQPGVYTVGATATGYDPASRTVNVGVVGGVLTGAATDVSLGLIQQTTLRVTDTGFSAIGSLPGATVTLLFNGAAPSNTNGGAVSVTDGSSGLTSNSNTDLLSGASDSATFKFLSANSESAALGAGQAGYTLVVTAPGYQSYFATLSNLTAAMTVNATLIEESLITGSVHGIIDTSPATNLAGATVTATLLSAGACNSPVLNEPPSGYSNTDTTPVTATTDASGNFVLNGSAGVFNGGSTVSVNGGLCPGATYSVAVNLAGYTSASVNTTALVAGLNALATITINAQPITQLVDVLPAAGFSFNTNALPTISVSSSLGSSFTCRDNVASTNCAVPTGGGANFSITVYPTSYTYTITASGFLPLILSGISYSPGASPSVLTETLQPEENTITGTVSATVTGGSSTKIVPGLRVNLYATSTPGTVVGSATTDSSGVYSIPNIPSGNYFVQPDATTGYADATSPVSFSTAFPATITTHDVSVAAVAPTTTTITVTTTATTANQSGATVSLTPVTPPGSLPACTNSSGGQTLLQSGLGQSENATVTGSGPYSASFSSLTPDYYEVLVAGGTIPTQSFTHILICPSTSPSTAVTYTDQLQEGEIDGTVTLTPASSSTPAVSISTADSGAGIATTPTLDCGATPSSSCSFVGYATFGDTYNVTPSLSTYTVTSTPNPYSWSPSAGSATQTGVSFTLTQTPTVSLVSPASGARAGGTTVDITGTGFTAGSTVKFGATAAASVTFNSATSLSATSPAESAGTVDITVTTNGLTSATSAADQFTFITEPAVTSVSPSEGPTAGGTTVTITGTSFTHSSTVKFGTTPAASVTFNSATSLSATSPAGSAGTVDITVATSGVTSATSSADQFTYDAVPSVTSLDVTSGSTSGGTTVTITGTGFTSGSTVKFGATPASSVTFNSSTSLTVTSPAGSAGTLDITVTTPGGTSATSSNDQFTYIAPPTVTGISPSAGPLAGGTSVTITGTGFSAGSTVKFGATPASSVTFNSSTSLTVTSPAGSAGTLDITVTTSGFTSATSSSDQFTYDAVPSVTHLDVTEGPLAGGTSVTITGTGFTSGSTVKFDNTSASSVTFNSSTSLTVTSPAGSAGTVDITVTTPGGTSATSSNDQFTYDAVPTVTSLDVTSGSTSGGTTVNITGTGFTAGSTVKFGTTAASSVTFNSSTSLTVTSPAKAAGTVDITVTTPGGTSATSSNDQFTYS
jgi:hypothetical protein